MNFKKHIDAVLFNLFSTDFDNKTSFKYPLIIFILFSNTLFYIVRYFYPKVFDDNLIVFFILIGIYYCYIFSFFSRNGLRLYLIKKFGENKSFEVNRFILNILFYFYGCSFFCICVLTSNPNYMNKFFSVVGAILFSIGFFFKYNSVITAGYDAFFAKDLFYRNKLGEFTSRGVYKYFKNPMYGPGYLHGYGLAIYFGSVTGLITIGICQILVYTFFYTIELPHIKENIFPATEVIPNNRAA